jgi:class 3 adenylate cyclase
MEERRTRRLAAVWFADIVGYTALSTRDEDAALAVVDEFQRLSRECVSDNGRVVKFLGDGALAIFDSTNRALESAIALRDAFADSEIARRHSCTISVGVHVGEVVLAEDGDVYGDGVNVASRIEGVATTNQVVVSEDVFRLIHNRSGYNPQPLGEHQLKGVMKPVPLYVLAKPGETIAAPRPVGTAHPEGAHRKAVAVGTLAGVAGFVLLSMFVAWSVNFPEEPGNEPTPAATSPATTEPPADVAPRRTTADAPTAATGREAPSASPTRPEPAAATTPPSDAPRATQPQPAPADAAPGNKVLVLVYGEVGSGANLAEDPILRSLGAVGGVTVVDASSAAMMRRDPEASRAVLQGDFPALAETARRNGVEYVLLGQLESSASSLRGNMYGGSAQLGLRMYRVSTGQMIDQGTFTTGMGSDPAVPGRNELAARTGAAQTVGRQGATAARRWLTGALRN